MSKNVLTHLRVGIGMIGIFCAVKSLSMILGGSPTIGSLIGAAVIMVVLLLTHRHLKTADYYTAYHDFYFIPFAVAILALLPADLPIITIILFAIGIFMLLFVCIVPVVEAEVDYYERGNLPIPFVPDMWWTGLIEFIYTIIIMLGLSILSPIATFPVGIASLVILFALSGFQKDASAIVS